MKRASSDPQLHETKRVCSIHWDVIDEANSLNLSLVCTISNGSGNKQIIRTPLQVCQQTSCCKCAVTFLDNEEVTGSAYSHTLFHLGCYTDGPLVVPRTQCLCHDVLVSTCNSIVVRRFRGNRAPELFDTETVCGTAKCVGCHKGFAAADVISVSSYYGRTRDCIIIKDPSEFIRNNDVLPRNIWHTSCVGPCFYDDCSTPTLSGMHSISCLKHTITCKMCGLYCTRIADRVPFRKEGECTKPAWVCKVCAGQGSIRDRWEQTHHITCGEQNCSTEHHITGWNMVTRGGEEAVLAAVCKKLKCHGCHTELYNRQEFPDPSKDGFRIMGNHSICHWCVETL